MCHIHNNLLLGVVGVSGHLQPTGHKVIKLCVCGLVLQPRSTDRTSELLPAGWSDNKELYSLRYKASSSDTPLLLKAITVDSTLIFNLMVGTYEGPSQVVFHIMEF